MTPDSITKLLTSINRRVLSICNRAKLVHDVVFFKQKHDKNNAKVCDVSRPLKGVTHQACFVACFHIWVVH